MGIYHLCLVLLISLVVFGAGQALATTYPNDSTPWLNTVNYANVGAGGGFDKYSCSLYGNDVDDDGICDNWETNSGPNPGLHVNFHSTKLNGGTAITYRYDLSCNPNAVYSGATGSQINDPLGDIVCPSPSQKDIYVEVDWMTGQDPSPQALKDVVAAYLKHGIHLHIQVGENPPTGGSDPSPSSGDIGVRYCDVQISTSNTGSPGTCTASTTNAQSYALLKQNFFGTVAERSGNNTFCPLATIPSSVGTPPPPNNNAYNCLTAKRQVFHYATFDNFQWGNIPSGGWAEVMGNDFLVSLGNFQNNGKGNIDEQEASFMHELGHNLGLYHGGLPPPTGNIDDDNCKPNYLSIMSYTHEYRETGDLCRPLDYSDRNLTANSLNEQSLSDVNMNSDPYPADNPNPPDNPNQSPACPTSGERSTWWSTPTNPQHPGLTGSPEDWNGDGFSTTNTYSQNINNLGFTGCNTATLSSLSSFDDWHYILNGNANFAHPLNFRLNPNFYSGIVAGNNDVEVGPVPDATENEQNMNMSVRLPPPSSSSNSDTMAPVVVSPSNQVVYSSDSAGMAVTYSAPTATDNVGVTSGPTCTPSSGSTFPVGTTTVTCTASDAAGNVGTATFTVTVVNEQSPFWAYGLAASIIAVVTGIGIWQILKRGPSPRQP